MIHLRDVMELMISTNKFQCFRKYCFKGNEKKTLNQHQLANISNFEFDLNQVIAIFMPNT